MPSSRDFFHDLFKGSRGRGDLNMLGMTYQGIDEMVRRAWGLSLESGYRPEEWRSVNVEDVLTFVDIGARMHPRGSDYHKGFRLMRDILIDFIVMMLSTRSRGQHCELLSELVYGLRPTDTIITVNYDTIADFTLQHTRARQYTNYSRLMRGMLPRPSQYRKTGLLLKLHGSVNWQTCENRVCRMYRVPHVPFMSRRRRLPDGNPYARVNCIACGSDRTKTAIIPPMSEKNLVRNDFFHRLWLIAREQLPRFDRILFIGYSFPPSDSYTDWLFRQLRFIEKRASPKIYVGNPEAMRPRNGVRQRYESLFRGFEVEYHQDFKALIRAISRAT